MRKAVKMGITVGLIIMVFAVADSSSRTGSQDGDTSAQTGVSQEQYNQPVVEPVEASKPKSAERVVVTFAKSKDSDAADQPATARPAVVPPAAIIPAAAKPVAVEIPVPVKSADATVDKTLVVTIPQSSDSSGGSTASPQGHVYVVKKGDAGFWGVAASLYGNGKYWYLIKQANPQADSTNLKPGQKLTIPPLPSSSSSAVAQATPTKTPQATSGAPTVYVVKSGDKGFWTAAKNCYGDGSLWPAIAKANPDVNADSLQPGQKLQIPTLSDARKLIPQAAPKKPSAAASSSEDTSGGPLFD